MIPPNLQSCYDKFHQSMLTAIRENPENTLSLTTQEVQFHSRRQVLQWQEEVAEFLPFLNKADRVLDFGTGSGISAAPFAYAGCLVDAIDITEDTQSSFMCGFNNTLHQNISVQQKAYWPYFKKAFPSITFQHYKDNIPFADNTFKGVMAFGVLEHIPKELQASVIKEIRRVLVPGGYLFIAYLPRKWAACEWIARAIGRYHHEWLWGDRATRRHLQNNGFDICLFKRVIAAPQHPASFSNRFEPLLNFIDRVAKVPPFDLLSHHMRIVAQKR